ncbi:hypothetical protein [Nocardia carnea]|uniref:Uncharacterized protein n=1 Tax=Nocardia carnea TaxID=37328 RepID=A0ABW7TP34_9NOCA|nr:hypothetical protein [Nocardia carnea]
MIRHKVAHRALPQLPEHWVEISDAKDGRTINTTLARSTFTMFLQLADQTIRGITEAAEYNDPNELWLPEDWLTGAIRPQRGVTEPDQLQLWFGRSLVTDSTSRSRHD